MNSGRENEKHSLLHLKNEEIELRLWEYIDGISTSEETTEIEKLIAANAEWKTTYSELLQVHQAIADMELEQPSMRFSRNVMEEIAKYQIAPAARKYINNKIIWGIAAFFITVIAGYVIFAISQVTWSAGAGDSSIGLIDFAQADYSRIFSNTFVNGFIMANIILGLMLLDRYLAQRKKEWH